MEIERDLSGHYRVSISREELMMALKRWREKPETRAMLEKMANERRVWVAKVISDMQPRRK